jgi:thymidylate synthase (FAD)
MNIRNVGEGKVLLLAGGGKVYTDIAARFVRSEKDIQEIVDSPYNAQIVRNIIDSGHLAATEFDTFIFAVSGYSRVTEAQLVRKRHASYLIKSGRAELNGKRKYELVVPKSIRDVVVEDRGTLWTSEDYFALGEKFYEAALTQGKREEDARYLKPQATAFNAIIGMSAHGLLDWFKIRCCRNAQTEIRDMANKMLALCKEAAPDLFANAGPSCVDLGYCPENYRQNPACRKKYLPKHEALALLKMGWGTSE